MDNKNLHIAFCVNDAYVPYMCVALKGIACNHSGRYPITVHILTDSITPRSRKLIGEALGDTPGITHVIHMVDDSPLRGLVLRRYTIYAWYRMLLPSLLPDVGRILYLDTDIAVNGNFDLIHDVDLDGFAIATPRDTDTFTDEPFVRCGYDKDKQYVCSGVLLMNLDYWREHSLSEKIIEWGHANAAKLKYPDQDSINYVCRDAKTYLPLSYGVTRSLFTKPYFYTAEYRDEMTECLDRPVVVHYAGCAPWLMESDHPLLDIWLRYNSMLPHPAKRKYSTLGITGIKVRIWDILHRFKGREVLTRDDIHARINAIHG